MTHTEHATDLESARATRHVRRRYDLAALASVAWLIAAVVSAQAEPWTVEITRNDGTVDVAQARQVIEASRAELAACAEGPGPHLFAYAMSVRANGTVREAAYDRGATSDARAARCIRHALLELQFPAHADASTLSVTLRAGSFGDPPPSTPPVTPTPPVGPTPPITPTPPVVSPGPLPSPSPPPTDGGDVVIGALGATAGRTPEQLRAVIGAQRPALAACYATARATSPTLAGDAVLHVTIATDGRVTNAMFQAPEALASALAGCVGQAARTWTFSAATAEERVTIPIAFGAASAPHPIPLRR